jgi:hypothetical protein
MGMSTVEGSMWGALRNATQTRGVLKLPAGEAVEERKGKTPELIAKRLNFYISRKA